MYLIWYLVPGIRYQTRTSAVPAVVYHVPTRVQLEWYIFVLTCGRAAAQSLLAQANFGIAAAAITLPSATAVFEDCEPWCFVRVNVPAGGTWVP